MEIIFYCGSKHYLCYNPSHHIIQIKHKLQWKLCYNLNPNVNYVIT